MTDGRPMAAAAGASPPTGWYVAPGFEAVADAFESNFQERGELGAAFAAYKDGRPIVDLWRGVADSTTKSPWAADTLQTIFSGTKGIIAICMLMLADAGLIDFEAAVSYYWPEFGAAGKRTITVRDVMSHRARIPGLETELSWHEATDAARVADLLARQPANLDPRAARTYHALTYGWICGEIIRRVDGRTAGQFVAEEIAGPLRLEVWIGLPPEQFARLARVELAADWKGSEPDRGDTLARSVANPLRFEHASFPWNEPAWLRAEVPAANGVAAVRSMAELYASLDQLVKPATLAVARRPITAGRDTLSDKPIAFGLGFQLQNETKPFGPPMDAFGHGGAGGSRHGYWPSQKIAFSYAMNLMREEARDSRATTLLEALFQADYLNQ